MIRKSPKADQAEKREERELAVLQWAERHAEGSFKQLLESATQLHAQATTLVTVLLAGTGGALTLGLPVFLGGANPVAWASLVTCGYLATLVALIVQRNLAAGHVPMGYADPKHIAQPEHTLKALLEVELENRQTAIDALRVRNAARGRSLNLLRLSAAATPVVFGLVALTARWVLG